ncbi:hypothetical protein K492DRAFT_200425 [Lichtheimia hyalospora FSU 10163]|nr:hypothetical protein K492DRAFT_200425 [Lichtheimia hyalospora FSU 10163]
MTPSTQRIMSACKEHAIRFNKHETNDLQPARSLRFRKVVDYIKLKGVMRGKERRIDFIMQLPNDIVFTMLIPMIMHDGRVNSRVHCPYLHVSKQWRDRIVECYGGLHFTIHWEEGRVTKMCDQLARFAPYAKSWKIVWNKDWVDGSLPNNDLYPESEMIIHDHHCKEGDHFLSSLRFASNISTRLSITFNHLPLSDLLSACPNMTCLDMSRPNCGYLSSFPSTPYPTLTTFVIQSASYDITHDQVIAICKYFPSLKKLSLSPCSSILSALVVSDYYPSMTHLTLGISYPSVSFTYLDHGHTYGPDGITSLDILSCSRDSGGHSYTSAVLYKFRETLVDLNYHFTSYPDTVEDIKFPRLKKLVLTRCGWWILRNAPVLQELEMTSNVIDNHALWLDKAPRHLETLNLKLTHPYNLASITLIENCVGLLAIQLQLKKLVIHAHGVDELELLEDAVGYLNHLEHLMISYSDRDSNELERFINHLAPRCLKLTCLKISYKNALPMHSICALKRFAALKHFGFTAVNGMEYNTSFWDAIQSLSQLKCIEIYSVMPGSNPIPAYIKDKRPDIKFIVHIGCM